MTGFLSGLRKCLRRSCLMGGGWRRLGCFHVSRTALAVSLYSVFWGQRRCKAHMQVRLRAAVPGNRWDGRGGPCKDR